MRVHRAAKRVNATPLLKGAASFRCRVVIMAKEPILGRVKTRLSREIGPAQATRFYRATAAALADRLTRDPRFDTWLGMSPDVACATRAIPLRALPHRLPQGHGDLGARMLQLARTAPPGPVLIVGTDIPAITSTALAHAFNQLRRQEIVVGPADDGGFWLIGFARRRPLPRSIFANVRWSHPETLADVLANCHALRVGHTAIMSDVDNAADLLKSARWVGRRIAPPSGNGAIG